MTDSKNPPKVELLRGEEGLLLDHNYDGIQELDHVLPRWWLWLLYSTIVFSAWYVGYYMSGNGPNPQQELNLAMMELDAMKPAKAAVAEGDTEALLAALKDPAKLKHGSEVYAGKCLACHGNQGQGLIGPNLTDDFWVHGDGSLKETAATVTNGVAEKGMPPWGAILTAEELRDTVAFVHSLHGTNPAGAKAPQGDQKEFKD